MALAAVLMVAGLLSGCAGGSKAQATAQAQTRTQANQVAGSPRAPAGDAVLRIRGAVRRQAIPGGFVGLSLEYPAVAAYAGTDPSALNPVFVQLIRNLNPGQLPVLRIGGDSTDWTWWPVAGMSQPAGVNYTLNDGKYIDKDYEGWGLAVTGDVKPWQNVLPGSWVRDDITFGANGGNGIGDQSANNIGLASNFGGALNGQTVNASNSTSTFTTNRLLYDNSVLARTIVAFAFQVGYEHFWTDVLRSQVDFSMNHSDVPSWLIQSSGTASVNKELNIAHVNLIWSPAPFVDTGVEFAWGHRVVVSNNRGDCYTLQTSMKVKF